MINVIYATPERGFLYYIWRLGILDDVLRKEWNFAEFKKWYVGKKRQFLILP